MKLLMINPYDDPADGGGAEVILLAQAEAFVERGHECAILVTSGQKGLHRDMRGNIAVWRAGIKNIYWPGLRTRRALWRRLIWHILDVWNGRMRPYVKHVIRCECPDIVLIHNLAGWSVAVWKELREQQVPFIQVLHDQYLWCPRSNMFKNGRNCGAQCLSCRLLRLWHRRWSASVPAVVGVSNFVLQKALKRGYFPAATRATVVHNALPWGEGDAAGNGTHPTTTVRFGFIGRLEEEKGIALLLRCFQYIVTERTALVVAGTGECDYVATLRSRYQDRHVRFVGRLSPRSFYPQIDVLVVPSIWNDTLPTVVMEGLAFGKAIIASRRGGIPEMLVDGRNAVLFDPDDPGALVAALTRVRDDSTLRRELAAEARRSSAEFTNRRRVTDAYEELFGSVISIAGRSSISRA